MAERRTGGQWLWSNLGQHHIAGHGCNEDDYSEESGNRNHEKRGRVRFVNDNVPPEELNGECIIVQKGRKKDNERKAD